MNNEGGSHNAEYCYFADGLPDSSGKPAVTKERGLEADGRNKS